MALNQPTAPAREPVLRVFGYAGLESAGSDGCGPIPGQAKHLALLIYLAVSKRGDLVAREDLLALLWPDADQHHARTSLRQALSCIRRALGCHVVRANGRHTVGIDRNAIWCDAHQFERLIQQDRPAEALELYRGHFAQGFHVSGGEAFEEWIEARRAYYRNLAVEVAWRLAEQAERDGARTEAAFWGKRAAGLSGPDELQLQRLLELLYRVGDVAGATRAYRGLVDYLAREWGAVPSQETERLFDRIKQGARPTDDAFSPPQGRRSRHRRTGVERRSGAAARDLPFPERRRSAERRGGVERRSGLDRRELAQPSIDP